MVQFSYEVLEGLCPFCSEVVPQLPQQGSPDSPSKKSKTSLVPHKRDVRIILEEKN
jgi:hypothetical protein